MPIAIGPHTQPFLPACLEGRRSCRFCLEPAWAHSHQGARITRRSGAIIDRSSFHFCALHNQRHGCIAIQQNASRGNLVAQPSASRLEPCSAAAGHHRRALGLNFHRLESAANVSSHRTGSRSLHTPQQDRKQFTRYLVCRTSRNGAHHIHVILKRDHICSHVHAETAPTTHQYRRRCRGHRASLCE